VYAGTDLGVMKSADAGVTWSFRNAGLNGSTCPEARLRSIS
jgi:hypothetical protein